MYQNVNLNRTTVDGRNPAPVDLENIPLFIYKVFFHWSPWDPRPWSPRWTCGKWQASPCERPTRHPGSVKTQHAGRPSDIPLRIPMVAWHIIFTAYISSWWLKNSFEKHMSQNGLKIFRNFRGEKIPKSLSCHHPDLAYKNQQKQGKIEPHTWIFLLMCVKKICRNSPTNGTNQGFCTNNSRSLILSYILEDEHGTYSHHPFICKKIIIQTSMIMVHINLPGYHCFWSLTQGIISIKILSTFSRQKPRTPAGHPALPLPPLHLPRSICDSSG